MKLNPLSWFKRETRAAGNSYTAQMMAARGAALMGSSGVAELSGTVQACVSLWESGLSQADVSNAPDVTPAVLGMTARQLALAGDAVFLMDDAGLIPAYDWDVKTDRGRPVAYRLTLPDTSGGQSVPALAGEVFHVRIGASAATPWKGTAPLHRASLTTGLLQAVESALSEVYRDAPIGSQITPMPENPEADNDALARSFRGQRGRVLLRESVNVTAAGGPAPVTDWRPSDLTPDLNNSGLIESLPAARDAVLGVYGVLPALLNANSAGPVIREGQRHLAQWQLQSIAQAIAAEASEKMGGDVSIDTLQPLQAYDAGGRARALSGIVQGLALAKEAGLSDEQVTAALKFAGVDSEQ